MNERFSMARARNNDSQWTLPVRLVKADGNAHISIFCSTQSTERRINNHHIVAGRDGFRFGVTFIRGFDGDIEQMNLVIANDNFALRVE